MTIRRHQLLSFDAGCRLSAETCNIAQTEQQSGLSITDWWVGGWDRWIGEEPQLFRETRTYWYRSQLTPLDQQVGLLPSVWLYLFVRGFKADGNEHKTEAGGNRRHRFGNNLHSRSPTDNLLRSAPSLPFYHCSGLPTAHGVNMSKKTSDAGSVSDIKNQRLSVGRRRGPSSCIISLSDKLCYSHCRLI